MSFYLCNRDRRSAALFGAALIFVSWANAALAEKITVLRDVPPRSAVHVAPPGEPTDVQTSPKDLVLALVPNGKQLSDAQVAGVFAQVQDPITGERGPGLGAAAIVQDATSRSGLTGSPDGGLSSVSSIGSNISDTVNSSVNQSIGQIGPAIQNAVPGGPGGG